MKNVQIKSYFWSVFSCIQSKYRKIWTRNNTVFLQFLCSVSLQWFKGWFWPWTQKSELSHNISSVKENLDFVEDYLLKKTKSIPKLSPFVKTLKPFLCVILLVLYLGRFRINFGSWIIYPKSKWVNDCILKDKFSLKYVTVDKVIFFIQELGQGCFLSKIDIENDFSLIPLATQFHANKKFSLD